MIHIFVGPMGSGKSYVAENFASDLGVDFVEGDDLLPSHMAEAVKNFKTLTLEEIEGYVKNDLIPGIEDANDGKELVVAQALYRKEHRDLIKEHFKDIRFYYVDTPLLTNLKRLFSRENGFKWCVYGLLNRPFFQMSDDLIRVYNR